MTTDAEKLEALRVALRDITYLSGADPAAALQKAQEIAYSALESAGFIPPRGLFETHSKV